MKQIGSPVPDARSEVRVEYCFVWQPLFLPASRIEAGFSGLEFVSFGKGFRSYLSMLDTCSSQRLTNTALNDQILE